MRTETVTYKIYKYSELSDDAKAKAFEWFYGTGDQYVTMQRNTHYAYCIAACNDYVTAMRDNIVCEIEIAEESERKPDTIINDKLINRLNMYVVEYFINLCEEHEEWGYDFFYPEDDAEFIELCEANDWEFYEDGTFYC